MLVAFPMVREGDKLMAQRLGPINDLWDASIAIKKRPLAVVVQVDLKAHAATK